jgi:hypothetical protein
MKWIQGKGFSGCTEKQWMIKKGCHKGSQDFKVLNFIVR